MEWLGLLALGILLCYSGYPGRVKALERKVKKLERKQQGGSDMSKIISDLVGKECKVILDSGITQLNCTILDADDEWVKISYMENKKSTAPKIKILRIEEIESVEMN